MKQVLIGYNWSGRTDKQWLFWLEKKLESIGFSVGFMELPRLSSNISSWIPELQEKHAVSEENTHVVPHDPGCLTILHYLERLAQTPDALPTLLVAGQTNRPSVLDLKVVGRKLIGAPINRAVGKVGRDLSHISEFGPIENKLDVKLVVLYGGEIREVADVAQKKALPTSPVAVSATRSSYLKRFFRLP